MKIYLLIENKTNKVVSAYRYADIALIDKKKGLKNVVNKMFNGSSSSDYRIEVMEVIE